MTIRSVRWLRCDDCGREVETPLPANHGWRLADWRSLSPKKQRDICPACLHPTPSLFGDAA